MVIVIARRHHPFRPFHEFYEIMVLPSRLMLKRSLARMILATINQVCTAFTFYEWAIKMKLKVIRAMKTE